MRLIDADELSMSKFHPVPYTHITPKDADAESYKRGWNDALDAVADNAPTIEPVKHGRWIPVTNGRGGHECDQCHEYAPSWQTGEEHLTNYCPNCGVRMTKEDTR